MMKILSLAGLYALAVTGAAFGQDAPAPDSQPNAPLVKTNVWVDVHVDKMGRITEAHVGKSSGSKEVDAKALASAKAWHFHPAMVNGQPKEVNVRVPVVVETYGNPKF